MKIVVLGGGAQGRVIASDLARCPAAGFDHRRRRPEARPAGLGNLRWREADASDRTALARLIAEHDLAVGALPSRYGFDAMQAAIDASGTSSTFRSRPRIRLQLDAPRTDRRRVRRA
jgi:saccharopine dehydrogenase-like NADP-dependent oxidoreductase